MINIPLYIITRVSKNILPRWLFVWDFEKPSNRSRSPPRSASSLISLLRSFSFNKEFTSKVNSPGQSFGKTSHWRLPSEKTPQFFFKSGEVVSVFWGGQGDMKKRVTYFLKIPVTLFFCSHTYPVLCWMEVVQMAVLGDIRKLIFHWSMILGPFTGHPNLLELNQKKQPASKLAAFKLHGSHS